jgi:hypothetical protein
MQIISTQLPHIGQTNEWSPYYTSYTKSTYRSSQSFTLGFYQNGPFHPTDGFFFQFLCHGEGVETHDITLSRDSTITVCRVSPS